MLNFIDRKCFVGNFYSKPLIPTEMILKLQMSHDNESKKVWIMILYDRRF